MLSQKATTVLSGAVLCLALAVPAVALEPLGSEFARGGPALAVCEELRQDMLFYHRLVLEGGNARQMEVWKRKYKQNVWDYGRTKCRELARRMAAAALREKNKKPEPSLASSF